MAIISYSKHKMLAFLVHYVIYHIPLVAITTRHPGPLETGYGITYLIMVFSTELKDNYSTLFNQIIVWPLLQLITVP